MGSLTERYIETASTYAGDIDGLIAIAHGELGWKAGGPGVADVSVRVLVDRDVRERDERRERGVREEVRDAAPALVEPHVAGDRTVERARRIRPGHER